MIEEEPLPIFHTPTEKYIYYAYKYKFEILFAIVFVLYIVNLTIGKRTNLMIATNFHHRVLENLASQFAQVGFG